jgi:hypothetical protein
MMVDYWQPGKQRGDAVRNPPDWKDSSGWDWLLYGAILALVVGAIGIIGFIVKTLLR